MNPVDDTEDGVLPVRVVAKKYEPYQQICSNDWNYEPFDEKNLEIRTLRSN